MSREIDRACERTAEILERRIAAHVSRPVGVSAFKCEDCGAPIPKERCRIIAGVTRCATCQSVFELKQKHYRSV
ncbi:TraR/DksA C4-type zinc finger protein [Xenorhabdus griffiniae]|uniref:TraR/DksA C4-type zinc finger protein n=1 Tax=Xenorhabdus griffiniae TaxID=351672 RepID=UPI00235A0571|nr:TraR/DksA C4-type zinc finger protein [Xenorhabdus griffiniae]MDC9603945.1 TraR/DksA C4-type zinc finger protein [Xenorhabdus griffiniae]